MKTELFLKRVFHGEAIVPYSKSTIRSTKGLNV